MCRLFRFSLRNILVVAPVTLLFVDNIGGLRPLQHSPWGDLNLKIASTNNKVIGSKTNILHKENRNKRHTCQEEQGPQTYWYIHEGRFKFPAELPPPDKHPNTMCPSGLAVHHPAYETSKVYATEGCPVKTDRNRTKEDIHSAVIRGPHESALVEEAIYHFAAEAKEKVASNQARLVCYKNFKGDLPTKMKVSPIAATPHKSKAFISILDL